MSLHHHIIIRRVVLWNAKWYLPPQPGHFKSPSIICWSWANHSFVYSVRAIDHSPSQRSISTSEAPRSPGTDASPITPSRGARWGARGLSKVIASAGERSASAAATVVFAETSPRRITRRRFVPPAVTVAVATTAIVAAARGLDGTLLSVKQEGDLRTHVHMCPSIIRISLPTTTEKAISYPRTVRAHTQKQRQANLSFFSFLISSCGWFLSSSEWFKCYFWTFQPVKYKATKDKLNTSVRILFRSGDLWPSSRPEYPSYRQKQNSLFF